MHAFNTPIVADSDFSMSDIVILDILAESTLFCLYKARRGTKYITLKSSVRGDAMLVEMLHREYELCCGLNHRSIVATLGFEEATPVGTAIIFEYIEGVSLDAYLSRNLSLSERRTLLADVLDGVDYLHYRGIVHNDLKPSNILVNANGSARIIDFGLSSSDDSLFSGCVGGTEHYSAPEIMRGRGSAGVVSDIYSLGRIIELIFGKRRYRSVVRRCTAEEPAERYPSVVTLRRALSWHRWRWVVFVTTAFVVTLLSLMLAPHIAEQRRQSVLSEQIAAVHHDLDGVFEQNYAKALQQEYREFVALARIEYLAFFQQYRSTIPASEQRALEIVYAEHIARFDSLLLSLPSIDSLSTADRNALIDLFNAGQYPR